MKPGLVTLEECWDAETLWDSFRRPRLHTVVLPVVSILTAESRTFEWTWENVATPGYACPVDAPGMYGGTLDGTIIIVGLLGTRHEVAVPRPLADVVTELTAAGWGEKP